MLWILVPFRFQRISMLLFFRSSLSLLHFPKCQSLGLVLLFFCVVLLRLFQINSFESIFPRFRNSHLMILYTSQRMQFTLFSPLLSWTILETNEKQILIIGTTSLAHWTEHWNYNQNETKRLDIFVLWKLIWKRRKRKNNKTHIQIQIEMRIASLITTRRHKNQMKKKID